MTSRNAIPGATTRVAPGGLGPAAIVLGLGLGGFFDGIVFHQLLQWHHMLSSTTPVDTVAGLQLNTLFDGLFHGATWILTVVGLWLLVRAARGGLPAEPGRTFLGGALAGWGAFNLVEGLVDHYLLGIHHVRPGPDEAVWDLAFLAWGALFAAAGWWLLRATPARSPDGLRRP
jgi:uncharacterized membrane protein